MIRAVFFDFYGTLATWDPPGEQIQQNACAAEGLHVRQEDIARAYPLANAYLDAENAKRPVTGLAQEERDAIFAEYERRLLTAAGLDVTLETAARVWARVRATPKGLALYPDVLPSLEDLHGDGLLLGIVSNIGPELGNLVEKLGLSHLVRVHASSAEAGVNKPHAGIFRLALRKAGVRAEEAIHVGDSYESDVVGARNAAIRPLLLWRQDHHEPPPDVPVVRSLLDVHRYVRCAGKSQ